VREGGLMNVSTDMPAIPSTFESSLEPRTLRTLRSHRPAEDVTRPLLVCGWTEGTPELLAAIEVAGGYRAAAVGDRSALALTHARSSTDVRCYQHLREMFSRVRHEAVLIGLSEGIASVVDLAADAGSSVILDAGALSAGELYTAAETAHRRETPFVALRPALRVPGFETLRALIQERPQWKPRALDVTLESRVESPERQLRDAVALIAELLDGLPREMRAAAHGNPAHVGSVLVEARYEAGPLAMIHARSGLYTRLEITGDAAAGSFTLAVDGDSATLDLRDAGEPARTRRVAAAPAGLLYREARHATAMLADGASNSERTLREATMLGAIEVAMATGDVAELLSERDRPALTLIEGSGTHATPPRRGHLRVVTA
jgi:hypothetical protein